MELLFDNITPVKFYPYPHVVTKRLINCDAFTDPELGDDYIYYRKWLVELFNNADIETHKDNKVVFEVEVVSGNFPLATLYIGFHDCKMSIGFDIHEIR